MSSTLIESQAEPDRINNLLDKKLPSHRKAYSDRTAWIMACLSKLAYLHKEEKEKLEKKLKSLRMQLLGTFDNNGTQAILISDQEFIALAFRGTEKDEMEDIKADINATFTLCESGGKIHSGFKKAFEAVFIDIQEKLDEGEFKDKILFITGHSLGGALATIATKKLSHKGGIAACYTFGSPRVGDDEWIESIKDPIFRVVNAADCVTMLPPGESSIRKIARLIGILAKMKIPLLSPFCESYAQKLLLKFGGYLHCGDMRYLTDCPEGNHEGVKLLPAVSSFYRIKGHKNKALFKKFLADHSIKIYRNKLMIIALRRNP